MKGFGSNKQSRIKELEQLLTTANSEISALRSRAASKANATHNTEMVDGVAEKGIEHQAAELADLQKQNDALQKGGEDSEETLKQKAQEIERLRPEDVPMEETTKQAGKEDALQDLSVIEFTDAAPQAQDAIRSERPPKTASGGSTVAPTPHIQSARLIGGRTPVGEMPNAETDGRPPNIARADQTKRPKAHTEPYTNNKPQY